MSSAKVMINTRHLDFIQGVQHPILKLKVNWARGLLLTELWREIIAELIGIISKLLHLIQLIHL